MTYLWGHIETEHLIDRIFSKECNHICYRWHIASGGPDCQWEDSGGWVELLLMAATSLYAYTKKNKKTSHMIADSLGLLSHGLHASASHLCPIYNHTLKRHDSNLKTLFLCPHTLREPWKTSTEKSLYTDIRRAFSSVVWKFESLFSSLIIFIWKVTFSSFTRPQVLEYWILFIY